MAKSIRPSAKYPDRAAIVAEVCERLSKGEPLAVICRDGHLPDPSSIWDWSQEDESLAQAIARARVLGFDAIADECLAIADMPAATSEGGTRIDAGDVSHRKLRIDTRLKLLAKWDPKRYGDRMEVEHGGKLTLEHLVAGSMKPDAGG